MNENAETEEAQTERTNSQVELNELLSVFLVLDCVDYEGCSAIRGYKDREHAEEFIKICEAYDRERPSCPYGDDKDDWNDYSTKYKEWEDQHPGECPNVDNYVISEVDLY